MPKQKIPLMCLAVVTLTLLWSLFRPFDMATWVMETLPVWIILPLLIFTRRRFPLTDLAYVLIAAHAVILIVGGHYSYARVPLFNWLRDEMGTKRNSYDGLGHLAQGFVPALVARELLIRTSDLKRGKWMAAVIILSCMGISAIYELLEWAAALAEGGAADEFLSTQGDVWDTQKDMLLAGIGAVTSLLLLPKLHDRQLQKLESHKFI